MLKTIKSIAGIVLYNPDIGRLKENMSSVCHQVDFIVLVDNASNNNNSIQELAKQYDSVFLIENKRNMGIAKALNQVMEYAEKKSIDWVLTLDQDSVVPNNLIEEYTKVIENPKIAIVTPNIVDRNFYTTENEKKGVEEVERCITSASLTNVKIWRMVGGFEEKLFIDYVDFEYCAKIKRKGYKIIKVNSVKLLHEVGNAQVRKIFGRTFIVYNHNPIRKYYFFRNIIYCMVLYSDFFDIKLEKRNLRVMFLKSIIFEKQKIKKIYFMVKGIFDGKRMVKGRSTL